MSDKCLWCDKPAEMRCSACHRENFCSARCHKTSWPVHKVLCQAEAGILRQPPLSAKEFAALPAASSDMSLVCFSLSSKPWLAAISEFFGLSGPEGTWTGQEAILTSLVPKEGAIVGTTELREVLIAFARTALNDAKFYPPWPNEPIWATSAFHFVGAFQHALTFGLTTSNMPETTHHFAARVPRDLNIFLRESILRQLAIGLEQTTVDGGYAFTTAGQQLQEVHRLRAKAALMGDERIKPGLKEALSQTILSMDELAAYLLARRTPTGYRF